MKQFIERAKHVTGGEEGMSNIELVVWIIVVLVIAIALFALRDNIRNFFNTSGNSVTQMNNRITETNNALKK